MVEFKMNSFTYWLLLNFKVFERYKLNFLFLDLDENHLSIDFPTCQEVYFEEFAFLFALYYTKSYKNRIRNGLI